MDRIVRNLLVIALLVGAAVAPIARAEAPCRLLVLGAMPSEIGPFLAHATIEDRVDVSFTNDFGQQQMKSYFVGTLEDNDVIMAMTAIGTVNAMETAQLAFDHFGCISGVVFSGVSGATGDEFIGDVLVPKTWTLDEFNAAGNLVRSTYSADDEMLAAAATAAESVSLSPLGYVGDVACVGIDPYATPTIDHGHTPTISVGSTLTGHSSDPFGGNAFVCLPGTDTFGCQPCKFVQFSTADPARLLTTLRPFLTPKFFTWFQTWSGVDGGEFNVQDMESAAVAKVAEGRAPFIAFRSPSDGTTNGEPLVTIPGPLSFLPQFLAYRQYASDNAAAVALAFLREWKAQHP